MPQLNLGKSDHSKGGEQEGAIGVTEGVALAGGELAHIGGIKTRTRALFLKTTPKKKMVFKLVSIAT